MGITRDTGSLEELTFSDIRRLFFPDPIDKNDYKWERTSGPRVRCIDADEYAILKKGSLYTVLEWKDPYYCEEVFWKENGGRVVLQEHPELAFFGRRFVSAKTSVGTRLDLNDLLIRIGA